MKQNTHRNATAMHRYVPQAPVARGMGTFEEVWQNYKDLILLGGIVVGVIYFMKRRGMSGNPDVTVDHANLVLDHIDEFAAEHSPKEVARVLGQVEKRFPSMAGRVTAARERAL